MQSLEDLAMESAVLERISRGPCEKLLNDMVEAVKEVEKSFCGSWLGYHSRVYYHLFAPVPAGARFSVEWGLGEQFLPETVGEWFEYPADVVESEIYHRAGNPDLETARKHAKDTLEAVEEFQAGVLSLVSPYKTKYQSDAFLGDLIGKAESFVIPSAADFINYFRPKGKWFTRDSVAASGGVITPTHVKIAAEIDALRAPYRSALALSKIARRLGSHLVSLERKKSRTSQVGTHVFIGHGRSLVWKELRDFIRDRLRLPWDEFNRVPVAGIATATRISQMLDDSAIAFLVLTAEDEQKDGALHPRMNVIHEAGLFQGRLGMEKAIILIEDGCEEFSNINGIGQIKFPKGNIAAAFDEVRRVLEREGLLEEPVA